jgi:phage baseplate assembly protein W
MIDVGRLFGRGTAFPFHINEEGRLGWSVGAQNIRESIQIILLTEPGERVMLPDFGAGLKRFLFQPNTVTTHRLIEEAIIQALDEWEPRVEVDAVEVQADEDDPRSALVTIRYTLIANQVGDQLQLRIQLAS